MTCPFWSVRLRDRERIRSEKPSGRICLGSFCGAGGGQEPTGPHVIMLSRTGVLTTSACSHTAYELLGPRTCSSAQCASHLAKIISNSRRGFFEEQLPPDLLVSQETARVSPFTRSWEPEKKHFVISFYCSLWCLGSPAEIPRPRSWKRPRTHFPWTRYGQASRGAHRLGAGRSPAAPDLPSRKHRCTGRNSLTQLRGVSSSGRSLLKSEWEQEWSKWSAVSHESPSLYRQRCLRQYRIHPKLTKMGGRSVKRTEGRYKEKYPFFPAIPLTQTWDSSDTVSEVPVTCLTRSSCSRWVRP